MKPDEDDGSRICHRVVDHELNTQFVADQFDINRHRVQQLAKAYQETDELPTLQTPGRQPYADYPLGLHVRILELFELYEQRATAIAKMLRARDGIIVDTDHADAIHQEYDTVTENPNKQGRRRP